MALDDGLIIDSYTKFEKNGVNAYHQINNILNAGLSAILFESKKTPYSFKKNYYRKKIMNRIKDYINYNKSEKDYIQLVRWINNTFVEIDVNHFSVSQKTFAYSINKILLKMKEDTLLLYKYLNNKEYYNEDDEDCNFNWELK